MTAVEGGVISSTRILLAALLGPWLAAEAPLGPVGWLGALLIFSANVVLAVRKGAKNPSAKSEPVSRGRQFSP